MNTSFKKKKKKKKRCNSSLECTVIAILIAPKNAILKGGSIWKILKKKKEKKILSNDISKRKLICLQVY